MTTQTLDEAPSRPKYDKEKFHKLYGIKKSRIAYLKKDFFDYMIMTLITACVVFFVYGINHPMGLLGLVLCAIMMVMFYLRHGFEARMPVILKRPIDMIYMVVYKIENISRFYLLALLVFILERVFIYYTPDLPHYSEQLRTVMLYLFYFHFIAITLYRTTSLVDHLRKRELVREFLLQTNWKKVIAKRNSITLEIVHAYVTGLLTHMVLIAPWFLILNFIDFSVVSMPVLLVVNFIIHKHYIKGYNAWFYRDHWLGHHSEVDFLYLHGTHHDAIPSGLIGVSGNGHLEGFFRHIFGNPMPLYTPVLSFLLYCLEVQQDIKNHQYIPNVFPKLTRFFHEGAQHSTHHMGRLEPYGIGLKQLERASKKRAEQGKKGLGPIPAEILESIEIDEQLNGFKWNSRGYLQFLELFDKYQKD